MKYFQIIVATICTVCFSVNISAQTVRPADRSEDNVVVYNSKSDLLQKVKSNIERKQGGDPEGEDDGPINDPNEGRRKTSDKKNSKSDKSRKIKLPKKDN